MASLERAQELLAKMRMLSLINTKNLFLRLKGELRDRNKWNPLLRAYPWGSFDSVELELCGLLRIHGWARDHVPAFTGLRVYIDAKEVTLMTSYRTYHPIPSHDSFRGFVLEYLVDPPEGQYISRIEIKFENVRIFHLNERIEIGVPHYKALFSENKVLHRDGIYGYGPPARIADSEVVALAKSLHGPIIDFGCGSGALIRALRSLGLEAFGVEIKRPAIIDSLLADVAAYITLYDGSLPLPLEDEAFESGMCVEVLEHVDDFEAVISELARVVRKRLIVTVPDMSAIPLCHRHTVVPWHLLESTHVNFFTQNSLFNVLRKHFERVEFARIGSTTINGTRFYVSLVALCDK